MSIIDNLQSMLARGQDSALLRYGLGNEYLKAGEPTPAAEHLAAAVQLDPDYSAAWKLYGKALEAVGEYAPALAAFDQGIATAERKGDLQAAKEMRVFRKRAEKALAS
ncbi:tetratricopeptide repeat protein [uncultured Thiodictyon sp.]|jgi:Tfp pilus assembly protein PilF|uniref:tetratricopeptide repeat protein n=1 Tax=uncultured Thiodictyon sp. TaxID=1846217 RepID=UPI0025E0CB8F|nr:tetratricopeptide repeat protein [uncultured Thiodictyon sp.]